jgi:hypothetical protein
MDLKVWGLRKGSDVLHKGYEGWKKGSKRVFGAVLGLFYTLTVLNTLTRFG